MKKGKRLEQLVGLVQEALKNVPGAEVLLNHKLPNKDGRRREFDVLIRMVFNELLIQIAIECKDYATAIPVEKIEAFNSKCLRIENISKKVFVAPNGFQQDAINAAKSFEIDLINFGEVSHDKILEWIQIYQLQHNFKIQLPITLIFAEEGIVDIKEIPQNRDLLVGFKKDRTTVNLIRFLHESIVNGMRDYLRGHALFEFMKGQKESTISFKIELSDMFLVLNNMAQVDIEGVKLDIVVYTTESLADIREARSYENHDRGKNATLISVETGKGQVAEIILPESGGVSIFEKDGEGKYSKLEVLASYEPKTGQFDLYRSDKAIRPN